MAWFEVFIPGKQSGSASVTLTVEAPNWIGALRTGLSNIGEGQESISNVMCDIKEDNSIHVTDVASHRVFRLREVKQPRVAVPVAPAPFYDNDTAPPTMLDGNDAAGPQRKTQTAAAAFVDRAPAAETMDQNTIEMSVPWTAMPSPSSTPALPNLLLRVPSKLPPLGSPSAIAVTTAPPAELTMPMSASIAVQADYDLTLRQPKAPSAPNKPLPAEVPAAAPTAPTPPVVAAAPAVKAAAKFVPEATERPQRAPGPNGRKKNSPVSPPTPRGSTAPPPKRPSGQFETAPQPISREVSREEVPAVGRTPSVADQASITDAVADVFDATQELLLEASVDPKRIADALLDIALAHVPAESGTFYLADLNGHELTFAAVRGPKAEAIKKGRFTVPVGQGIVGFCALEGVCLGVTDIQKDPRYFSAVADAVGYTPRDTLCASAEKDGRLFGAIQLINAKQGFTAAHMEVLRYIGLTAAQLLERHFDAQT